MMHSARAVSAASQGSMLPASISPWMCLAVAWTKKSCERAVGELDLAVVGRRVRERLHHGPVALEDRDDARSWPRG